MSGIILNKKKRTNVLVLIKFSEGNLIISESNPAWRMKAATVFLQSVHFSLSLQRLRGTVSIVTFH